MSTATDEMFNSILSTDVLASKREVCGNIGEKKHREGKATARSVVQIIVQRSDTHQSYRPVGLQVYLGRGKFLLARGCQFLSPVFHVHVLE